MHWIFPCIGEAIYVIVCKRNSHHMKTLSVIVPTYNVEEYIGKCLSSLIVDREDLEVLVIIDGSKDRSCEIAKRFQDNYSGIFRVIEKQNGHYGSCVNTGLSLAQGKYVKVLDADDFFDSKFEDYIEFLSKIDVDVVLTDYVVVDENNKVLRKREFSYEPYKVLSIVDLVAGWFSSMQHSTITYRTELLRNMSYRQTEGISYTDLQWSSLPFSKVKTFAYYPDIIYRYMKGRSGQSIDIEYRRNNMWMENKVVLGLANSYEQIKQDIDPNNRIAVKAIIQDLVTNVYRHYLLNYPRQLKISELKDFDENILNTSPEIYRQIEDATDVRKFGSFYYIKDFRAKGTRKGLRYLYYDIFRGFGELIKG